MWIKDLTITTGLVDTYSTPTLIRLVTSGQIDANPIITHHFAMDEFDQAYDTFAARPTPARSRSCSAAEARRRKGRR